MSDGRMEVDAAEAKLKQMAHSEQHYFKRCVAPRSPVCSPLGGAEDLVQENANLFCVL